jgi:formate hydrogenlyase subunit 4
MVNENDELHPGLEEIPSVHSLIKATESRAASGSLMGVLAAMGYVIDVQVSKPTSPVDSNEDAEADIEAEEIGNSASATINEQ